MNFFKFKMQIGSSLSLSEKYIGLIGHDLGFSKKYLLLYSRKVKQTARILHTKNEIVEGENLKNPNRNLQTALTPEFPHLFYTIELPYKHTGVPMSNYEFFLFQKNSTVPNPDVKSDVKFIQ
jgi:hypothetical protein